MFSYSKGYYVSPPDDQYLKFKNRCSLMYMHFCGFFSQTMIFRKGFLYMYIIYIAGRISEAAIGGCGGCAARRFAC
jgi:hypothetical protein